MDVIKPARRIYLFAHDPRVDGKDVLPGPQDHDDLFEGRVARPLTDAVDRAFHLARPVLDCGNGIGHGKTQIIVAVDADDGPGDIGNMLQ